MEGHLEVSPGRSTSSTAPFPHRDGGLLQDSATFPEMKDEDEPQPGVVLKLAEVTGCDLDTCCAALVACQSLTRRRCGTRGHNTTSDPCLAKAITTSMQPWTSCAAFPVLRLESRLLL
ncbi:unnamed protein product [Symbiodinium sp. CCMP2592]|nr:unnamed protein product [Symbiodinium sp. CCMP2592]